MVTASSKRLSLEAFLALPDRDNHELIDGNAVPKMSPKRFHAGLQKSFIKLMDDWAIARGHFYPEWAVLLERDGEPWVPVPDLTYVSFERLSANWLEDEPCPVPPDLAIEIISPNQSFGMMAAKAADYIAAGVSQVWVVDSQARTITVFVPSAVPVTYRGEALVADQSQGAIARDGLAGLDLVVEAVFGGAGL
ncbi:MAG: Uma2 family endonuclease [Elainellaceae cyanobacterium]